MMRTRKTVTVIWLKARQGIRSVSNEDKCHEISENYLNCSKNLVKQIKNYFTDNQEETATSILSYDLLHLQQNTVF